MATAMNGREQGVSYGIFKMKRSGHRTNRRSAVRAFAQHVCAGVAFRAWGTLESAYAPEHVPVEILAHGRLSLPWAFRSKDFQKNPCRAINAFHP